ncbi:MAG TPA: gamma-glutamyltransferase [Syntrophales bacterium]|nr:gamma-glutamyltransferase [Syntrophales bacterium]
MKSLSKMRFEREAVGMFRYACMVWILFFVFCQPLPAATKNVQVEAAHGMVASAHPLASEAGLKILKAGGNAVDAAVAAAFAIGVVELNASGLGGEGMIVIYRADTKTAVAIDYRSAAPASATFPKKIPDAGYASAAIPGTVAGLSTALAKYGTMPLHRVMAPAIGLAEQGFTVSPTLAGMIQDNFDRISKNPPLAAVTFRDGLPLEAGATLKNPDLALSLHKIAAFGPDVFYRGELAEAMVAEMAANGGFFSKSDLASYKAVVREPVRGRYRGYELISAPPPVGGLSVIQILQILENFDLAKNPPTSTINVHLMAEAMKKGFADFAAFIGDPDFEKIPVKGLLSPEYAKKRAAEIRADAISARIEAGEPSRESGSTTALCVVDRRGNVVALTQTISSFFGARVMIGGTGIILNNEMQNFSAKGVNAMAPGKRMRTTISPTIMLKNGKAYAAMGTPGAARIISTMAILVSNLVDHKMPIQEAIEAPRFFARDKPKDLYVETRLPADTLAALERMGYALKKYKDYDLFFGGAQGIVIDPKSGKKIGGADPRRDGVVVGY